RRPPVLLPPQRSLRRLGRTDRRRRHQGGGSLSRRRIARARRHSGRQRRRDRADRRTLLPGRLAHRRHGRAGAAHDDPPAGRAARGGSGGQSHRRHRRLPAAIGRISPANSGAAAEASPSMTETIDYRRSSRRRLRLSRRQIPVLATAIALIVGYVIAGFFYRAFFTVPVAINLLQDHATLGVIAVGMTFVILSGGIDLSVGAAVAATSIALARLIENNHWNPAAAM